MPMTGLRECIAEIAARLAAAGSRTRAARPGSSLGPRPTRARDIGGGRPADARRRTGSGARSSGAAPAEPRADRLHPGREGVLEPGLRGRSGGADPASRDRDRGRGGPGADRDKTAALRILDLGTGSGCLLLALLSELPCALGLGVDAAALAVARRNAERLGLAARAEFRQARWGAGLQERFALIVSNPPYVAEAEWARLQPEIRRFEPKAALVAGPTGSGRTVPWRRIARVSWRLMACARSRSG